MNKNGFTILEIVVSLSLFTAVILLAGSFFISSQRNYNKGSDISELTQNARVCLDRLSRELRQSTVVVTELPESEDDPEDPPAQEIFFQDGHDMEQTTYIKYYLQNSDMIRSKVAYYFDEEPDVYVTYNSIDEDENPPEEIILESKIVGEHFQDLYFWSDSGVVYINISLEKNKEELEARTCVFSRN